MYSYFYFILFLAHSEVKIDIEKTIKNLTETFTSLGSKFEYIEEEIEVNLLSMKGEATNLVKCIEHVIFGDENGNENENGNMRMEMRMEMKWK